MTSNNHPCCPGFTRGCLPQRGKKIQAGDGWEANDCLTVSTIIQLLSLHFISKPILCDLGHCLARQSKLYYRCYWYIGISKRWKKCDVPLALSQQLRKNKIVSRGLAGGNTDGFGNRCRPTILSQSKITWVDFRFQSLSSYIYGSSNCVLTATWE